MSEDRKSRGLGRGLAALLGDPLEAPRAEVVSPSLAVRAEGMIVSGGGALEIPIELLERNPHQPRRAFAEAEIEELAQSIREKGVISPILVRPLPQTPGRYQIIAGERRWRAAQKAGLHVMPVIVRELNDLEVLEVGIVENIQREDLNPIEEAQAYRTLMERFGRTQEVVAKVVAKSRPYIANALRLLNLPEAVQDHVLAGRLSAGHARALIGQADAESLAMKIIEQGLSVRQVEQLIRDAANRPTRPVLKPAAIRAQDADTLSMQQDLESALGLKVALTHKDGRGEIRLSYETLEQLDEVCKRLMKG